MASPAEVAGRGYIGQLFEVAGFSVSASQNVVNEGSTLQLSGGQLPDDATTLAVNSSAVTWSVAGGALASINSSGLATAQIVFLQCRIP